MRLAQQGDRQAYARLLKAMIPILRRASVTRWPRASATDIEDAVQEALLALHAARHLYDPARPFLPFLLGILRHRGADVMRRRQIAAREVPIGEIGETSWLATPNTSQEVAVDERRLREAIALLPAHQRSAVEVLKLQGFSLKEASAATGISVAALKVATHRAIRSLRKLLRVQP